MDHASDFLEFCGPGTGKLYRRALAVFQEYYAQKGTIEDFWILCEEDQNRRVRDKQNTADKEVLKYVDYLKGKDYSTKTIQTYLSGLQSFFRWSKVPISFHYIKNKPAAIVETRKHPWTLPDIAKFSCLFDSPKHKTILAFAVQSGLGIADILGLRWMDIKEEFEAGIVPLCLDFPEGRKKMQRQDEPIPFTTFVGEYAVNLLRAYLNGKQLQPKDRLFPVSSVAVDEYFARLGRVFLGPYPFRNPCSPHTFRAFFRTALGDAKLDPDFIEYFLGHKISEQRRTYVAKDKEGWRQVWKTAEAYLTPPMQKLG